METTPKFYRCPNCRIKTFSFMKPEIDGSCAWCNYRESDHTVGHHRKALYYCRACGKFGEVKMSDNVYCKYCFALKRKIHAT